MKAELQLQDVYEGLFDGPHATPKPSEDGPIFLGIKNITEDGRLDLTKVRHISEAEWPKWTKRVTPRRGDIVFSYEATLHRYAIIPEGFRGCLGRRMALIRPDTEKVNTNYLFYYFFSDEWRQEVSKYILTGATVDRIPLTKAPEFKIYLPPKEQQDTVANVISVYDNLIENNNRRIAILEEMVQSLYREWFVKFRFPGHENTKFIDSPVGKIPEGWEVKSFGDLVKFRRDLVKKGVVKDNTPYMGLEHFPRKSIALSEWEIVSEIGSTKLAFQKGDILFGKIRPYFHKVGIAQIDGLCSSDTFVWRAVDEKNRGLVLCVASSDDFVAHSVQTSQGTKMPRANWDVLGKYLVVLPSKGLMGIFNDVVNSVIEQIRVLGKKQRNLRNQRDLLLPKLVSGAVGFSNKEGK